MPKKKTKTPAKPVAKKAVTGTIEKDEQKVINKGGRPRLELDANLIEELASIHCTYKEIASVMGCGTDVLRERYIDAIERGIDRGNMSLKRKMYRLAIEGNVMLLIWLSKQRLGYRERQPDEAPQTFVNVTVNEVP